MFAGTDDENLSRLEQICARYEEYNVKLAIKKCTFYAGKIKWGGGREFENDRYSYDQDLYDKVLSMPKPALATDLASFLHTITWLGNSRNRTDVVGPKAVLQRFLDGIFKTQSQSSRKCKLLEGLALDDFG